LNPFLENEKNMCDRCGNESQKRNERRQNDRKETGEDKMTEKRKER